MDACLSAARTAATDWVTAKPGLWTGPWTGLWYWICDNHYPFCMTQMQPNAGVTGPIAGCNFHSIHTVLPQLTAITSWQWLSELIHVHCT